MKHEVNHKKKIKAIQNSNFILAQWASRNRRPDCSSQRSSAIIDRIRREALERKLAERLAARKAGRK